MEQRPPFCTAKRDGSTIDSQKSWLAKDYYTQFQSDSELEKKYAGLGDYKVVLGNDDRQAGTGIATYSQGGVGAVRAVTECENNGLYKTIFTGSAAHSYLAQMWGGYDASKVSIPWFMAAAAGTSDDTGATDAATEWLGVAPLSSLIENYNAMPDNVFKLRARVEGAEHEEMQMKTDGYMTAWMLYQLQGDEEAGKALIGEDAEILSNSNWQDIEKNR